jgi:hypothetical protein
VAEVFYIPFIVMSQLWMCSISSLALSSSEAAKSQRVDLLPAIFVLSTVAIVATAPFMDKVTSPKKAIPLFLGCLAVAGLFHAYAMVSRRLVCAERGQIVGIAEYAPTMFLFLASIIGVWILQPRINQLYKRAGA